MSCQGEAEHRRSHTVLRAKNGTAQSACQVHPWPGTEQLPCEVSRVVVDPHLLCGVLLKPPHVDLQLLEQQAQRAARVKLRTLVHHALKVVLLNLSHELCRLHSQISISAYSTEQDGSLFKMQNVHEDIQIDL